MPLSEVIKSLETLGERCADLVDELRLVKQGVSTLDDRGLALAATAFSEAATKSGDVFLAWLRRAEGGEN
jgi:hypothetical protein